MDRGHVIALLKQHEPALRRAGMGGLYLFGSVARAENHAGSDVDIFFDRDAAVGLTLFDLAGLQATLTILLGSHVDLMTREAIHPRRRPRIEAEAVKVF